MLTRKSRRKKNNDYNHHQKLNLTLTFLLFFIFVTYWNFVIKTIIFKGLRTKYSLVWIKLIDNIYINSSKKKIN